MNSQEATLLKDLTDKFFILNQSLVRMEKHLQENGSNGELVPAIAGLFRHMSNATILGFSEILEANREEATEARQYLDLSNLFSGTTDDWQFEK